MLEVTLLVVVLSMYRWQDIVLLNTNTSAALYVVWVFFITLSRFGHGSELFLVGLVLSWVAFWLNYWCFSVSMEECSQYVF